MKIVFAMRSNTILPIKRVTHTKTILNLSLMIGTPEQLLKFMEDLNVVICGNGLNNNGHAHFNLTCSSLKDCPVVWMHAHLLNIRHIHD
jgi:hypothetical protein